MHTSLHRERISVQRAHTANTFLRTDTSSRANSNTPVYFARTSNKERRSRLHYTSRSCCRTLFTPFRRLVQHAFSSSVLTAVRIKFKFALSTTVAQKVKEYYFIAFSPVTLQDISSSIDHFNTSARGNFQKAL